MGRAWGQGAKPTQPVPLKEGGLPGPAWPPLSCLLALWMSKAAQPAPFPPGVGAWGGGVGKGGGVTEGLHSPRSSSTNVDEVVSQGSRGAHFLFRPQAFPRQAPPGCGGGTPHSQSWPLGLKPLPTLPSPKLFSHPHHQHGKEAPGSQGEAWPPPQAKLRALSLGKLPLGKWMVAGLLSSPGEDLTG